MSLHISLAWIYLHQWLCTLGCGLDLDRENNSSLSLTASRWSSPVCLAGSRKNTATTNNAVRIPFVPNSNPVFGSFNFLPCPLILQKRILIYPQRLSNLLSSPWKITKEMPSMFSPILVRSGMLYQSPQCAKNSYQPCLHIPAIESSCISSALITRDHERPFRDSAPARCRSVKRVT